MPIVLNAPPETAFTQEDLVRSPIAVRAQRWRATLAAWLAMESGRSFLWVPVWLIVGVAIYFALPVEPQTLAVAVLLSGSACAYAFWRHSGIAGVVLFAVTMATAGVLIASIRSDLVAAPILEARVGPAGITGTLVEVERRPNAERYTVAVDAIGAIPASDLPARVRITARGAKRTEARVGDIVEIRGVLNPPPVPVTPGGFDYGRQLYFERIGGVGYAFGPAALVERREGGLAAGIERLRTAISQRVMSHMDPAAGAVAAALVTGQRASIPPEITDWLRDTGLAHLLAISGLHMGLVCGFIFFSVRFALACSQTLAARYPIKKWAAIAALAGGTFYLMISGGAWSARRAFLMAAIVFIAILFDRRAISLRNVAFAAIVIILMSPEAVVSAGFQMSFAAVTALIAVYELQRTAGGHFKKDTYGRKVLVFFLGLALTSLIAGMATSPFAIYHFNRIASYGLLANLIAMPIFTLWVMPLAVLGLALMPLGLDPPLWAGVEWGLERIFDITGTIAGWEHAVMVVPQWPATSFVLTITSLIVVSLLRSPLRWLGLGLVPVALLVAEFANRPSLYVAEQLGNYAVLTEEGPVFANRRRERFAADKWLQGEGIGTALREQPLIDCANDPCTVRGRGGLKIAGTSSVIAAARACREADVVVLMDATYAPLSRSCPAILLTPPVLARTGPVAVKVSNGSIRVQTVAGRRGRRPWNLLLTGQAALSTLPQRSEAQTPSMPAFPE
jgi:competence protein ComEC